MTEVLGFSHLSLSVTDLARSTPWYQQVLGLELVGEAEGRGFRRARLRAPSGSVTLTLTAHDAEVAEPFDERRPGLDHVAFDVGGVGDVEAMKARLVQLAVAHSDIRSGSNGTAAITLRDPDNIQIEVFGGP